MAKEKRKFTYKRPSREDVKARANMRGGGFNSYIKPGIRKVQGA